MEYYESIKNKLLNNGYIVIPNVLNIDEINTAKELFFKWKKSIPNIDIFHDKLDPHGIYKYHEIGHQRHAWYLRKNKKIQDIFKYIWDTDELIVSFDGTCYMPSNCKKKNATWTHTDQAPNIIGFQCYQSFVSLTDNSEKTLVIYEGTKDIHHKYFLYRNIKSNKNWQLIDHDFLNTIKENKKILNIPAGSLVIWDSRTFHQNQYGKLESDNEERLVQYLCYFPKNHIKNTKAMQKKRRLYFDTRRTTSHWPCPIHVNGKQPRTYGDDSQLIDYATLPKINLDDMLDDINKLI